MRFIHSLSTRSLGIQLYDDTNNLKRLLVYVVYYATSVAYLKRINQKIVLHTDSLGERMLGYLPYDEIHLTCDDIPENIHPRFWAYPKMFSMSKETLNSIHIDGDVFIKKQSLVDDLEKFDFDVLVQNFESAEWYDEIADCLWIDENYCLSKGLILDDAGAYNTGIFGFNNQELKDKFLNGYFDIVNHYSNNYKTLLDEKVMNTPDVVVEQQYIYQLAQPYNKKILIESEITSKDFCSNANKIGYQHVITRKAECVDKCLSVLKQLNEDIYNKTIKICQILNK